MVSWGRLWGMNGKYMKLTLEDLFRGQNDDYEKEFVELLIGDPKIGNIKVEDILDEKNWEDVINAELTVEDIQEAINFVFNTNEIKITGTEYDHSSFRFNFLIEDNEYDINIIIYLDLLDLKEFTKYELVKIFVYEIINNRLEVHLDD